MNWPHLRPRVAGLGIFEQPVDPMNRTKPVSLLSLSAVICALSLSLFIAVADAKTLRYASQDDPQTLDPHSANLVPTNRVLSQVYESLVMRDKNFKLVPALALSWSQPDAKTWRFKLRPNVKFHGGEAFTADDVVFSVERALNPLSQLKSSVQGVASAKKVDNLTVDLLMKEPNPSERGQARIDFRTASTGSSWRLL